MRKLGDESHHHRQKKKQKKYPEVGKEPKKTKQYHPLLSAYCTLVTIPQTGKTALRGGWGMERGTMVSVQLPTSRWL